MRKLGIIWVTCALALAGCATSEAPKYFSTTACPKAWPVLEEIADRVLAGQQDKDSLIRYNKQFTDALANNVEATQPYQKDVEKYLKFLVDSTGSQMTTDLKWSAVTHQIGLLASACAVVEVRKTSDPALMKIKAASAKSP